MTRWFLFFCCLAIGPSLFAQSIDFTKTESTEESSMFNIKAPTLGGKQFWTDHAWRRGWKIQNNVITGHFRLLNEKNVRYAWGTRQQCLAELDNQVPDSSLKGTEVVILMHGLMRSSSSMKNMGNYLESKMGIQPIYFEYASSRGSISEHAFAFGEFVESLPKNTKISLVGHSMGNIVARHFIGDLQRSNDAETLSRIQSVVMLGPPNQGSSIARQLAKTGVFGLIAGKGGMELGKEWEEFQTRLATPPCPFGIIAGKLSDAAPQNPLVDGNGDFVVSFEETQLEGSADVLAIPRLHTYIMDAPEAQEATVNFIRTKSKFSN